MADYSMFGITALGERKKLFQLQQSLKAGKENLKVQQKAIDDSPHSSKKDSDKKAKLKSPPSDKKHSHSKGSHSGSKSSSKSPISRRPKESVKSKIETVAVAVESPTSKKPSVLDKKRLVELAPKTPAPGAEASHTEDWDLDHLQQEALSLMEATDQQLLQQKHQPKKSSMSQQQEVPKDSEKPFDVPKDPEPSAMQEAELPLQPQRQEPKIRVCVRKRPLGRHERAKGEKDIVIAESATTLFVAEPKVRLDLTPYVEEHRYTFDQVFGHSASNQEVYSQTAKPLINSIFEGAKATCFAYGQTGSGKTHTMIGKHDGLYIQAAKDIFAKIVEFPHLKVFVAYFEIYGGKIYDLLNDRHRLFARDNGQGEVLVRGLKEIAVSSVKELLSHLDAGSSSRSTGSTKANQDSSRSHAVLQIALRNSSHVVAKGRARRGATAAGDNLPPVHGKFSFIDLAGSERGSETGQRDRDTRLEGAEINKSLLALKECIRALDCSQRHLPFRQSTLTQVLKDSFIGNSRTCMIATVSPASTCADHTLNTLRYADRVKEMSSEGASSRKGSASLMLTTVSQPKQANNSSSNSPPPKDNNKNSLTPTKLSKGGRVGTPPKRIPMKKLAAQEDERQKAASAKAKEEVQSAPAAVVPVDDDSGEFAPELIEDITAIVALHRRQCEEQMGLLQQELELLESSIDGPSPEIELYVETLDQLLEVKEAAAATLRGLLDDFKREHMEALDQNANIYVAPLGASVGPCGKTAISACSFRHAVDLAAEYDTLLLANDSQFSGENITFVQKSISIIGLGNTTWNVDADYGILFNFTATPFVNASIENISFESESGHSGGNQSEAVIFADCSPSLTSSFSVRNVTFHIVPNRMRIHFFGCNEVSLEHVNAHGTNGLETFLQVEGFKNALLQSVSIGNVGIAFVDRDLAKDLIAFSGDGNSTLSIRDSVFAKISTLGSQVLFAQAAEVEISNCTFSSIDTLSNAITSIESADFVFQNSLVQNSFGAACSYRTDQVIRRFEYRNNRVFNTTSALYVVFFPFSDNAPLLIQQSSFVDLTGVALELFCQTFAGSAEFNDAKVEDSTFIRVAPREKAAISVIGFLGATFTLRNSKLILNVAPYGALFSDATNLYIENSVFLNNSGYSGGSINTSPSVTLGLGHMQITDTLIVDSSSNARASSGSAIFGQGQTQLWQNVTLRSANTYPVQATDVTSYTFATTPEQCTKEGAWLRIAKNSTLDCSAGSLLLLDDTVIVYTNRTKKCQILALNLRCQPCALGSFTLLPDRATTSFPARFPHSSCSDCPDGGHCSFGRASPLPGFWANSRKILEHGDNDATTDTLLHFYPCEFCQCSSKDRCSAEGCAEGRNGVLCGVCAEGYEPQVGLEGLLCEKENVCSTWHTTLVFLVAFVVTIIYSLFLLRPRLKDRGLFRVLIHIANLSNSLSRPILSAKAHASPAIAWIRNNVLHFWSLVLNAQISSLRILSSICIPLSSTNPSNGAIAAAIAGYSLPAFISVFFAFTCCSVALYRWLKRFMNRSSRKPRDNYGSLLDDLLVSSEQREVMDNVKVAKDLVYSLSYRVVYACVGIVEFVFATVFKTSLRLLHCVPIVISSTETSWRLFISGEVRCFSSFQYLCGALALLLLLLPAALEVVRRRVRGKIKRMYNLENRAEININDPASSDEGLFGLQLAIASAIEAPFRRGCRGWLTLLLYERVVFNVVHVAVTNIQLRSISMGILSAIAFALHAKYSPFQSKWPNMFGLIGHGCVFLDAMVSVSNTFVVSGLVPTSLHYASLVFLSTWIVAFVFFAIIPFVLRARKKLAQKR